VATVSAFSQRPIGQPERACVDARPIRRGGAPGGNPARDSAASAVGMMGVGPLSCDERRSLRSLRRQAVGRVALRAQMVLLSARGYSVRQIATLLEEGESTVRTWLRRYEQQGIAGLTDLPRPGRPRKYSVDDPPTPARRAPRGRVSAGRRAAP
jgi:hypothetical protein